MKNKNLVIAAFAFALAIGSAFTYASLPAVTAFIKVKYSGESAFTCRSTNPIQCTNSGSHACKVLVADILEETNAYNTGCSVFLKSSNDKSVGTIDPAQQINEVPENVDEQYKKSIKAQ
jgi:hypothetical protein